MDIEAAKSRVKVCRVPGLLTRAVAEHALPAATINRKTHKAYNRVKGTNFALNGLLGLTCTVKQLAWWVKNQAKGFATLCWALDVKSGIRHLPDASLTEKLPAILKSC